MKLKKTNIKNLNEIIDKMTELETDIAEHSYYNGTANKNTQLQWFHKLHEITSQLNNIYKAEKD